MDTETAGKGGRPPLPDALRKQPVCVRLPPDLLDRAYRHAIQEGESLSQVMQTALARMVGR
jgi:hypothetical protein